jgi:hypothetical protein
LSAVAVLRQFLADGPQPAVEATELLVEIGFTEHQIRSAREQLPDDSICPFCERPLADDDEDDVDLVEEDPVIPPLGRSTTR